LVPFARAASRTVCGEWLARRLRRALLELVS